VHESIVSCCNESGDTTSRHFAALRTAGKTKWGVKKGKHIGARNRIGYCSEISDTTSHCFAALRSAGNQKGSHVGGGEENKLVLTAAGRLSTPHFASSQRYRLKEIGGRRKGKTRGSAHTHMHTREHAIMFQGGARKSCYRRSWCCSESDDIYIYIYTRGGKKSRCRCSNCSSK